MAALRRSISAEAISEHTKIDLWFTIKLQNIVREVPAADHVVAYALKLARLSRPDDNEDEFVRSNVSWGAGPRASQFLVAGGKANAIVNGNTTRLNWLALGMIGEPLLNAIIGVGQRYLSATIGEGLIADLRNALFNHMQRMSLRFFTHTKTGELMSRLNTDVVGAQNAITGTFINIVTNLVTVIATLTVMFSLEWRLTLLSIAIVPLFVAPTRRVGRSRRVICL